MSEYSPEVLRYSARRVLNLTAAAMKRRNDRDLYFRWIMEGFSTQIPFDEYKAKLKPQKKKSAAEILSDTQTIMEGATWELHSLS